MPRIDLVPPIKGIDRSMPLRAQADLTCPDAQNVRDFAPLNSAQTVGKRSGIAKAFQNAAGDGSGTPITGICVSARSNEIGASTSGVFQRVSEAWRVYAKPTAFQGFFYGLDFRGEYVRFGRRDADYASRQLIGTGGPNQEGVAVITGGGLPDLAQFETNFASNDNLGFAVNWETQNNVSATMNCYRRCVSAGDNLDPVNFGPFVRGTPGLGEFIVGYLVRVSDNVVRPRIDSVIGNARTQLGVGTDINLSGTALLSNDLTLTLTATSVGVTLNVVWPSEGVSQNFSVLSTSLVGNARAGLMFIKPSIAKVGSERAYYRRCVLLEYDKRIPPPVDVVAEILGSNKMQGQARYQIPPNWEAYDFNGSSDVITRQIASTAGYSSATRQTVPTVDTVEEVLYGRDVRADRTQIFTIEAFRASPPDEHYDVQVKFRNTATEDDSVGAVFCCVSMPS